MSKPNIPEGGFKHTMLDPQFGKLVPDDFPDERTKDYVQNKEYWSEGPRFEGQSLYPEFWVDFEILTGIKVPENDQYSFFSCSC